MKIKVTPIKAFTDNYIWAIQAADSNQVALVDPGQSAPCIEFIEQHNLQLNAILITHHHWDHTNGIEDLLNYAKQRQQIVTVYGPATEDIPHCDIKLKEGDDVLLTFASSNTSQANQIEFSILDLPGHTLGHIAYVHENALFCGDTLFSGGCGRLFEGTPAQMHASLTKLASLPESTPVYCTHEYTLANLHFALAIEPKNQALQHYFNEVAIKREQNQITLPSSIKNELQINPFLRCGKQEIINAATEHSKNELESSLDVFTVIRGWKDSF